MCLYAGTVQEHEDNLKAFSAKMKKKGGKMTFYKAYTEGTTHDIELDKPVAVLEPPYYNGRIKIEQRSRNIVSDRRTKNIKREEIVWNNSDLYPFKVIRVCNGIHVFETLNSAKIFKASQGDCKIFEVEGNVRDLVAVSADTPGRELVFMKIKATDPKFKNYPKNWKKK